MVCLGGSVALNLGRLEFELTKAERTQWSALRCATEYAVTRSYGVEIFPTKA